MGESERSPRAARVRVATSVSSPSHTGLGPRLRHTKWGPVAATPLVLLAFLFGSVVAARAITAGYGLAVVLAASLVALLGVPGVSRLWPPFVLTGVAAYVVFDRLFAHLGVRVPGLTAYPGEIVLATSVAVAWDARSGIPWRAAQRSTLLLVAVASALFLVHLPGQPIVNAVRDFSLFYYLGFAYLAYKIPWERAGRRSHIVIAAVYGAQLLYSAAAITRLVPTNVLGPLAPYFGRPDIEGANLAGGAAYFAFADERLPLGGWGRAAIISLQLGVALLSASRAVFVCVVLAAMVVLFSKRARPVRRRVLLFAGGGVIAVGLVLAAFPGLLLHTTRGQVRPTSVVDRVLGTVGIGSGEQGASAQANLHFRTHWWATLAAHDVQHPEWLVLGRGFGPNLAKEVGYSKPGSHLRAPHNVAVDVFARMGIVGLVAWLWWLGAMYGAGLSLIRSDPDRDRGGQRTDEVRTRSASTASWMLVHFSTILVVALFGVVLESPFGAIPFYFLAGAIMRLASAHMPEPHPVEPGYGTLQPGTLRRMPATLARRVTYEVRSIVSLTPRYVYVVRHRFAGAKQPELIDASTELVIEGVRRSGNTFAVTAFRMAQDRPVALAHHLHAAGHVLRGVGLGLPVLVIVRPPADTVVSEAHYDPEITIRQSLRNYVRFHRRIAPHAAGILIATFDQVTSDFGAVIDRLNGLFGTEFRRFEHTEDNVRRCFEEMERRHGDRFGSVAENRIARPSEVRRAGTQRLLAEYGGDRLRALRERSEHIHEVLAASAV